MATDPRALSFTEEEQKLGKFTGQSVYQPSTKLGAQYIVPKVGDTYRTLAENYNIDQEALMRQNDFQQPQAGAALQFGGLTQEEEAYSAAIGMEEAIFEDVLKYQESKTIGGLSKFATEYAVDPLGRRTRIGGKTALTTEEGIQYPEGWNPAYASWFITQTEESGYWDAWENLRVSIEEQMDLPKMGIGSVEIDPRYQSYTVEELEDMGYGDYVDITERGPGGIPTSAFYEKDLAGEWQRKAPEAVFDELYEMNGIDPNDTDMVQWFWSFADNDLLHMGEFFEAIEWPYSGVGRGGYGGYNPNSYKRSRTPDYRQNYNAYLQLTSWSI